MIVQYRQFLDCPELPSEIRVYYTEEQLESINEELARRTAGVRHIGELGLRAQRDLCRALLDGSRRSGAEREVVCYDGLQVDSNDLGKDLTRRFMPETTWDAFDPDYRAVNLIFHVFDPDGERLTNVFYEQASTADLSSLEPAFLSARQIVMFCLTPPSLAS